MLHVATNSGAPRMPLQGYLCDTSPDFALQPLQPISSAWALQVPQHPLGSVGLRIFGRALERRAVETGIQLAEPLPISGDNTTSQPIRRLFLYSPLHFTQYI